MTHHESGTGPATGVEIEMDLLKAQVSGLEKQVRALAEATLALAHGMEAGPLEEPGQARPEHTARLAHELLLAAGLVFTAGESA
ncbi:hypothetical protein [Microtetraspora sp. NBRC 16547]|uniref:hypothetical protein n=1 Tax=Microtetraspora sp. NBRC 16547 TaxID=3030993 RepID=UPI00249FF499|nr:hypothetical protein [Microtetraspora sp. NBRC 16547]GLX02126.1 hypothetical protein Misp02_62120 [Microtetraspora sp. NBRC 16547]